MSENQTDTNMKKGQSVLITGGSGLIGRYLTSYLISEGYEVSHLSRNPDSSGNVRVFRWNPEKNLLDPEVFDGIDFVIHLAGANIGEKRWTVKRKEEILNSRVESARLIFKAVSTNGIKIKAFITASASGYYGTLTSDNIFTENAPPANDFLGTVCSEWEKAADLFSSAGIRTVKIRTAVVLEKNDSALSRLMKPARYGFLVQTGNGTQFMPWIHIMDLCKIYLKALNDEGMRGAYNAVAPQNVTNKTFMQTLAKVINRPLFPIPVPATVLKLILGEMSDIILKGSRISSEKISLSGYAFEFDNLEKALEDVINNQIVK
jgi:uncharacterized protein (TIGR01777 family)